MDQFKILKTMTELEYNNKTDSLRGVVKIAGAHGLNDYCEKDPTEVGFTAFKCWAKSASVSEKAELNINEYVF